MADRTHGTYASYKMGKCRCSLCRAAVAAYEKHRTRQTAYGRWTPYVDAAPARAHVRTLMSAGIGLKRVRALAGVSQGTVFQLVYGRRGPGGEQHPSARIRPATADRLLAVQCTTDHLAAGAHIDATGTRRRLQALIAAGWSQSKLATRLGMNQQNFNTMLCRDAVTAGTARAVVVLYDALWDVAPPQDGHRDKIAAARSRNYARTRGWVPPLGWDEDTIDDPDAADADVDPDVELDEVMVQRFMAGTLTRPRGVWVTPELIEAITRLTRGHYSDAQIAARIRTTPGAVCAIRRRHRIPSGVPSGRTSAS